MIDQRFCTQIGTPKQHNYICVLCDKLGEPSLRHVVSSITGVSVSKCQRTTFTAKDASKIIDVLKERLEREQATMNGEWLKIARQTFPDTQATMLLAMAYDRKFTHEDWPITRLQAVQISKVSNFKQWRKEVAAFDLDKRRYLSAAQDIVEHEKTQGAL